MKTTTFNKRDAIVFKHFNRKGYSLFAALGKVVVIGVLAVPTLTHARACGIATRPANEGADTLSFGEQRLDEVQVTGSRAPLTARQSAKIVEVISRDDIHRAEAQTINDVLKLATGVDVRQRGGFGVQTDISINGGTFDQITILLNGMPLGSPQTGHNAADFPVSLDDIDHIEVLEGAAARVFGSAAFSGAINIVTTPRPSSQGTRGWEGKATLEGGSFGSFGGDARVAARLLRPGSGAQASSQLFSSLSAGYNQSDGGTVNSGFRNRHGFYQGQLSSAIADVNWQAGISSKDYGANTFYSARFPNQYEWTRRYMGSVSVALHPLANGGGLVRSLDIEPAIYVHRDIDHYQLTKGATGASNGENYHRMDVYGGSLSAVASWAAGKTAIGADIRKEHILSTAYGELLDEAEWKAIGNASRSYDHMGNRTNTSLFLEHDVILGGLTVSAGLMANRNTGLDDKFRLYPGVDISFRPDDHWKVYASWNKAMRLPTFTDLYTNSSAQKGDIALRPERNNTFKGGVRYRAVGFEALASVFYCQGRDMIDWVYETAEAKRYQAMNIGKLDNLGLNIEAKCNMSRLLCPDLAVEGKEPWLMTVGYAYINQTHKTDKEIYKSLYALEYLRHKFVATISHPIVKHLSASWSLRWQQRMNGYHPYAKLDGKVQYEMRHCTVFVKADNMTCHGYYDLGTVKQPGLWIMAGTKVSLF